MKAILFVAALVTAISGPNAARSADHPDCPPETAASRRIAEHYAASPAFASTRANAGVPSALPADVRLLSGTADAETCKSIRRWASSHRNDNSSHPVRYSPTFYQVGELYYVVFTREPEHRTPRPGRVVVRLGWSSLYILDSEFKLVSSAAM